MSLRARPLLDGALRLLLVGSIAVGAVVWVHHLTEDRIAAQQKLLQMRSLNTVLPPAFYNNDPLTDTLKIQPPHSLHPRRELTVYRARLDGQPSALALQLTAADGYNGDIQLMVGIALDQSTGGSILGVRVIEHRETPGLGDKIERRVSPWVDDFAGRTLNDRWAVRKDGGDFDQFTGATITPRAVVRAVSRALDYATTNRQRLFETPAKDVPPTQ